MITGLVAALTIATAPSDTVAQGVEYRIEATLDEAAGALRGRAAFRYTNRAEVALDTLWFHLHLNAFRPNSAWSRRDTEFGIRRFQDLGPEEHAFERLGTVTIEGEGIDPVYPGAPDSTVVAFPLPGRLEPGSTTVVGFDWTARPSTLPRRQGRRDRHWDFAQWYPRIAAYTEDGWQVQPLLPQGEFFGEFASYDVTLEVAADQIVGATGVPVDGDPGWTDAAARGQPAPDLQRDFYPASPAAGLGLLDTPPPAGRKRIRWRAEDVHHFAWSANPEFIYETGTTRRTGAEGGAIPVHVLYQPGDDDWAGGVAVNRTIAALDWLQDLVGPYPWPQLTNLHRIESGGTEFPMLLMDGSASEGLIVHETAHQFFHGILANNEFRDGWLDEGVGSFLTDWYHEEHGNPEIWTGSMRAIRQMEQRGETHPIATPGAAFSNPNIYSAMTYTKAELVMRMLRWLIGEETMREGLRTLYERHALSHIDEADFRTAFEDAYGEDLDWFFDQWLHTTDQLDYRIVSATVAQATDDSWTTTVEVERIGDVFMPVDLRVGSRTERLSSEARRQVVEMITEERPTEAVLDPEDVLIDVDPSNNRRTVMER
ncbi:MAG: M1 family metallopeptidase [Gemmatimonadota bacterium]